jgi:hypothetical protein
MSSASRIGCEGSLGRARRDPTLAAGRSGVRYSRKVHRVSEETSITMEPAIRHRYIVRDDRILGGEPPVR